MKEDLTVREYKLLKSEAEQKILMAIHEFQRATGAAVSSIDIDTVSYMDVEINEVLRIRIQVNSL